MAHRILKDDGRDMCSECGEEMCNCGLEHPAIHEVSYWFDISLLTDQGYNHGPNYSLGSLGEPAAGLRAFRVTPWFHTVDELEAFCRRNLQRFKDIIAADEDAPAPDATNWE